MQPVAGPILRWLGMGAVTTVLYVMGRGALPVPPLLHPGRIPGWWQAYGPLLATFGVLRGLLFWTGCYLAALGTAAMIAACLPRLGLIGWLGRARLPGARLVARSVLGLAAAGAVGTASAEPGFATGQTSASGPTTTAPLEVSSPAPVLRYIGPVTSSAPGAANGRGDASRPRPASGAISRPDDGSPPRPASGATTRPGDASRPRPASGTSTRPGDASRPRPANGAANGLAARPSGRPRQQQQSASTPGTSASPNTAAPAARPQQAGAHPVETPDAGPRPAPSPPRRRPRPAAAARAAGRPATGAARLLTTDQRVSRSWLVRPGDNLWSIAADMLEAAWGRHPDVSEVAPYWWRVVQVNRPNLPNPSDPNLLLPGDRVTLPAPPPASRRDA